MNQDFKRTYTRQEADELLEWMKNSKLSGEIQVANGIRIVDIEKFFSSMYDIVNVRFNNPSFAGQLNVLVKLKKLDEAGLLPHGSSAQ